ncbi:molecular chaperone HscC [Listeria sp. FSL L7-1582]|uniref:molecular chaperone HscC n=1 Tax=Listeria portnoyi TaxID=2713504 RepID=UPI00164E926A|nr:molecular chaperone HscC [Listeria portnoyi]MBC6309790.1 molecular chaperone HscC [Listeria portnoyi]
MAKVGIDLGTSNSLVSYWNDGKTEIIPNVFGNNLTPSVVGIDDDGDILIGEVAKERLITHSGLTAASFKRFMGTEKKYQMGKHILTPTDLSAFILKNLRADAENFLGESCTQAVISVPAYFNDIQRQATMDAARLAGLEVTCLISEPTAAAIAYGLHQTEDDITFLVIDLGGGTFDVSLLEMFDGVMQVRAIAGDNFLGGEDFTQAIVSDCLESNGLRETLLSSAEYAMLKYRAEKAKQEVTTQHEIFIVFEVGTKQYEYELTEAKLQACCEMLLLKMRAPIMRVLRDSDIGMQELEQIILIGGATKMPLIRTYLSKLLGQFPYTLINPDEAVGLGTAIQSALKEKSEGLDEIILTDVCAFSLGTEVVNEVNGELRDGFFAPVIERNTTIPVSKEMDFYTANDNQASIKFTIYQGENRLVVENLKLGELEIKVPKAPKHQLVKARFTYDTNGILEVIVTIPKTGETKRLVVQNNTKKLTDVEMETRIGALADLKIHPRERDENRLLLARAERLFAETLGERRKYIEQLILQFEGKLAVQEEWATRKAAKDFHLILNQLEEEIRI